MPHTIFCGVDYGTTFSGLAWTDSSKADHKHVNLVTTWPGGPTNNNSYLQKVPSQIAYKEFNASFNLPDDRWGYEVEPGMVNCSWTKLLLDRNALPSDQDDPDLRGMLDRGIYKLPANKSVATVVCDFLRRLYSHFMNIVERHIPAQVLAGIPIEFWFTVPALWSDEARDLTLQAATKAGFGSRPYDTINLIPEPEAAAIFTLQATNEVGGILEAHSGVMVCDCGGGTVDIITYSIEKTDPRIELRESCPGDGAKCGSTFVDRNFHCLMIKRYGTAFTNIPRSKIGPGSKFMYDFDVWKKDFDGRKSSPRRCRLKLRPDRASPSPLLGYDEDEDEIEISSEDLKLCFDPVVSSVLHLIKKQLHIAAETKGPSIRTIILVGGLSSSPYFYDQVKQWCSIVDNIQVLSPPDAWSAIARGAALRGLEGAIVTERRCRRHYGTDIAHEFREGIDLETSAYLSRWDGRKMAKDHMHWHIQKGEKISPSSSWSLSFLRTHESGDPMSSACVLYSCSLNDAPEKRDHPRVERVGEVQYSYSGLNLNDFPSRQSWKDPTKTLRHLSFECVIHMGSKVGTLQVSVEHKGKVRGSAVIDYSHD